MLTNFLGVDSYNFDALTGVNRKVIPFVVCGDLSGFDSDATYPLNVSLRTEFN